MAVTRTYGSLALEGVMWTVRDLAPHAAIRFKRMFPRINTGAAGALTLSDGDDVRSDLLWFESRYPLVMDARTRGLLEDGRRAMLALEAEVGRICLPEWKPASLTGFRDGRAPYGYQAQAGAIAVRTGRLLILDDVGLGKTVSALAALAQGAPMPAAVVCDAHLADQWVDDFIEPFTHFRAHIIKGTKPYKLPPADIYIFRYSNVGGWSSTFGTGFFRTVIFDEIQSLRHGSETAKGKACSGLARNAAVRIGLTATPVYNYGAEAFNVVEFIAPGELGTYLEFTIEWGSSVIANPDALGAYLQDRGVSLRRREDDGLVNQQRPPVNTIAVEVPYDSDLVADEEALARELAYTVLQGSFVERGQAARQLDLRLRKVTGVAKARHVAAYVNMLAAESEKIVLAGWHRDVYDMWLERLGHLKPVMYTGTESPKEKRSAKEAFVNGDARLFVLSLRSGAGLDGLQEVCNDVVFGELDWSPQVHKQVIGRLRRPPNQNVVNAHYLHADGGADPGILEMLGVKADQARGIVDPGKQAQSQTRNEARIRKLAEAYLARTERKAS